VHNGRLGVIWFNVFDWGGWVEDRVLVKDLLLEAGGIMDDAQDFFLKEFAMKFLFRS
jgi:hypothetical protein